MMNEELKSFKLQPYRAKENPSLSRALIQNVLAIKNKN